MEIGQIFTALAAGGIAGPLTVLFLGNRLTKKREYEKWMINERCKLYSELLSMVTHIPKDKPTLDKWTYNIRDISLRIHILFENGTAPTELDDAIESVFQLARTKKKGTDTDTWSDEFRNEVRVLRLQLSKNIEVK